MEQKYVSALSDVPYPSSHIHVSGLELLKSMDPPRMIKTHLPFQLVPPGFWENECKVKFDWSY